MLISCLAACKSLGLDFVGVDVALDSNDNICVFECNSAPWLSSKVAGQLAAQIKKAYPIDPQ
jgi:glutathione synthase/RimK-type ligase-like ATP-grasp enzyme